MRDDTQEQLAAIRKQIDKARDSLEKIENYGKPETLRMNFVDVIPLGQFPDDDNDKNKEQG